MADTIANDRYLRTPISLANLYPQALGDYRDSLPLLPGNIRLDSNLYNNPSYLQNITDNLGEKVNWTPEDILRHEIIHAGQDKFNVKNKQVNTPDDRTGRDRLSLNNLVKNTISNSFGPQEWLAHSLQSKNGEYLNNSRTSMMGKGNTSEYQKYLLNAIMNSPQIHPGFKQLLLKMGYKGGI